MYTNNAQDGLPSEPIKKVLAASYDLRDVCCYLIDLMSPDTLDMDSWGIRMGCKRLLEEIELFFSTLTVDDNSCR
jgi:hypothetical protein